MPRVLVRDYQIGRSRDLPRARLERVAGERGCKTTVRLHLNDVECDRFDPSRLYSVPVLHHPPPRS